jgi:hypothetical protein
MNRTVITGVLAFVVGFVVSFLWLQEAKVKPLNEKLTACEEKLKQVIPAPAHGAEWETLTDGTKVMKIWEKAGPDWPQMAIFQLSNDQYKEFQKDPSTFMNARKIYPKDVQPHATLTQLVKVPSDYTGGWLIANWHVAPSSATGASYPAEEVSATKK